MSESAQPERRRLIDFLKRGGVLVREDFGGAVGVRWGTAHRCGTPFETPVCERLLETGCKVAKKPHALRRVEGVASETYKLAEVAQ